MYYNRNLSWTLLFENSEGQNRKSYDPSKSNVIRIGKSINKNELSLHYKITFVFLTPVKFELTIFFYRTLEV